MQSNQQRWLRPRLDKPRENRTFLEAVWTETWLWFHLEFRPFLLRWRFLLFPSFLWGGTAWSLWFFAGMALWFSVLIALPILFALMISVLVANALWINWRISRLNRIAYCPRCRSLLRTGLARQCFSCGHDWH
jgi:hypothetical protein